MYGGWPAFYRYFFETCHLNLEEVQSLPIYLACLLLGAMSPDHTNVRMTIKDQMRYYPEKVAELFDRMAGIGIPQLSHRQETISHGI